MMPTIRIEDDVFQGLKNLAEPFSDTPNSVIRRLLEEKGAIPMSGEATPNLAKRGGDDGAAVTAGAGAPSLTPQPMYENFLVYLLGREFNGRAGKREVTNAVIREMQSRRLLVQADLERVSTGETRAENTIAWARNALKDRGFIKRESPRGVWELTPKGLERSKNILLPKSRGKQ